MDLVDIDGIVIDFVVIVVIAFVVPCIVSVVLVFRDIVAVVGTAVDTVVDILVDIVVDSAAIFEQKRKTFKISARKEKKSKFYHGRHWLWLGLFHQ